MTITTLGAVNGSKDDHKPWHGNFNKQKHNDDWKINLEYLQRIKMIVMNKTCNNQIEFSYVELELNLGISIENTGQNKSLVKI